MMVEKRFKVNILSPDSIKKLQDDLMNYEKDLTDKITTLCQRLSELGVEVAKANVVSLEAVFTGELFNSIKSEQVMSSKNRVIFSILSDSDHAVFVEFGTGIIGAKSPYPGKLPAVYAQGKTIRQLKDGRYGWFYELNGQWYFTEGMPSRPFMYFASIEIYENIVEIAKEVFA